MLTGMDNADCLRRTGGHADLRYGRMSAEGQVYLVTFVTHDRRPLFSDAAVAHDAARAATDRRLWYRSRLLAWVLMPDHWHGLIELGAMESLSVCVQRLKTNTSRAAARPEGPRRVWAPGFHDRAIRSDDGLRAAARYLVANPLRAGLVDRIGSYPYWDAVWLQA
jgi:Transposase and inactivated derivatives